jgi:putative ABC transport system substrate-binding protein
MRRVGVLFGFAENDPEQQQRLAVFKEGLAARGWKDGSNLRIDVRWTNADINRASAFAKDLVTLNPDVILSSSTPATAAVQRETRSIPIVFASVADPVGSGFVNTLSRPGGNITGFLNFQSTLIEKWLELLKQIAPRVTRVAVMFNPATAPYAEYYLQPLRAAAPRSGLKPFTAPVANESDIERVIVELGRDAEAGLLCMTDSFLAVHRKSIIELAARHRVPTMYFTVAHVEDGGLIAYSIDILEMYRRAALYVDRILRGAKPEELPVEQPTKFELTINMKTAKALGIKVPQSLLVRADKVIE